MQRTPRAPKAPGLPALAACAILLAAAVAWSGGEPAPLLTGMAVANAPVTGLRGRIQATVLKIKPSINDLGVAVAIRTLDNVQLVAYVSAEAGAHVVAGRSYEMAGHTDKGGLWLVDLPGSVHRLKEPPRIVRVFTGCVKGGQLLPSGPPTDVPDGCYRDLKQRADRTVTR